MKKKWDDDHVRVLAGMSVYIKYTVRWLYFPHRMSRWEKNMRLARFSLHFARNRMTPYVPNVHGNHYTSTYFILLSDRLIFRNSLSLEKKTSTCHSTLCGCQRAYFTYNSLVINNDLSHLGGYIYSVNRVSQSSFRIVAGTCPCIKFVNAGDLE